MSDPALKAPWELVDSVGPDGKPKEKEPDAGDYMSALSMLLGLVAFWFRYKIFAWGSLFTCMSAIARMKSADMDFTKVIAPLMFSIMGLFMLYMQPAQQPQ